MYYYLYVDSTQPEYIRQISFLSSEWTAATAINSTVSPIDRKYSRTNGLILLWIDKTEIMTTRGTLSLLLAVPTLPRCKLRNSAILFGSEVDWAAINNTISVNLSSHFGRIRTAILSAIKCADVDRLDWNVLVD